MRTKTKTKKVSSTATPVTPKTTRKNGETLATTVATKVSNEERPKEYFTKKELSEFLVLIDKKISLAESEVRETLDASKHNITPKEVIPNSEVEIKIVTELLGARFMKYLESLRKARLRVLNKTFGMCYACPKPHMMDKRRLLASLHTTSCVEAKEKRDQRAGKGSAYVYQAIA
jgi:RNA polymerase-binding transcription factor DksA